MPHFTCTSCNETLKKPQVAKHLLRCRTSSITCMDCQKEFTLKGYTLHFKCISEQERYQGSMYVAKANKGEEKQDHWTAMVLEALQRTKNQNHRKLLNTISIYTNIPRKKAKFINFCENSIKFRDTRVLSDIFDFIIAVEKQVAEEQKAAVANDKVDGNENESVPVAPDDDQNAENDQNAEEPKKKKKKRVSEEIAASEPVEASEPAEFLESEAPKKKKQKKFLVVVNSSSSSSSDDEIVDKTSLKKKAKKKYTFDPSELVKPASAPVDADEEPSAPKKKKKKRHQEETVEAEEVPAPAENEEAPEESEEVPKKKKRKRHRRAAAEEVEVEA